MKTKNSKHQLIEYQIDSLSNHGIETYFTFDSNPMFSCEFQITRDRFDLYSCTVTILSSGSWSLSFIDWFCTVFELNPKKYEMKMIKMIFVSSFWKMEKLHFPDVSLEIQVILIVNVDSIDYVLAVYMLYNSVSST